MLSLQKIKVPNSEKTGFYGTDYEVFTKYGCNNWKKALDKGTLLVFTTLKPQNCGKSPYSGSIMILVSQIYYLMKKTTKYGWKAFSL